MPKVTVKMISCEVETYKSYLYEMLVDGVKYTLSTNNIDWKHIWYKGEPLDENYIEDEQEQRRLSEIYVGDWE